MIDFFGIGGPLILGLAKFMGWLQIDYLLVFMPLLIITILIFLSEGFSLIYKKLYPETLKDDKSNKTRYP